MTRKRIVGGLFVCLAALSTVSCSKQARSGQLGSETNWLGHCKSDEDCRTGDCLCGICTSTCSAGDGCEDGTCALATTAGYQSLCAATPAGRAPVAVCAADCKNDRDCASGMNCAHGVCVTAPVLDTSDPCSVPEYSTTEEAVAAVKCRFSIADGAALVYVRSDANGDMRADGRSRSWIIEYLHADAGADASLFHVDSQALTRDTASGSGWCSDTSMRLLPSSVVVPDAAARVRARTSFDAADYFIVQEDDSCNPPAFSAPNVVLVLAIQYGDAGGRDRFWFSFYDEKDTFQKLCGPCASNSVSECTACSL